MDLNQAIRTGYFRELNNSILFQGNVVRIFDSFAIPAEVEFPYIVMANISSAQVSVKRCFVFNASTQIDIMTGSIRAIRNNFRTNSEYFNTFRFYRYKFVSVWI